VTRMADGEKISFAAACSRFFGKLHNQSVGEFAREIKGFNAQDRAELKPLLEEELKVSIGD